MTVTGDGPGVVVRVSGLAQEPGGTFAVRVSFGDAGEYDLVVTDPAEAGTEKLLAWYFEEHLRYPFLDKDYEQDAGAAIAAYGQKLFAQVLGGAAYADYVALRKRGFDGCRIEVSGPAGLHRLHWEALRDPGLPVPLAVRLPVTRRVTGIPSQFDPPGARPTLNVLVVTARPDGPRDVGYRTVSQPLLDAVRTASLPVTVDLVRPGTWEALVTHLQAARDRHGSGWYHVVHFDVHGAFEDYRALEAGREADRLLFGNGAVAPFVGKRGFVFFETAEPGKAEPVAAQDVAGLLAEHRMPVAVLNACQSAMQDDSEAGLAQRLAEAGVPVAVGMAYSVTVSAAARAMPVLYAKIAAGAELAAAVQAARRDLLDHPARQAYFDQELDLADWMLPVMFAQQPLQIQLRPMTDAEQAQVFERAAEVGDEPYTEYGFVGRDLDIQAIEHAILTDTNILLVQGMAGAGKSTLLRHLGWWWRRTGLAGRVFRFSYEDRAWTAGQIIREIRSHLLPPAEHARADSLSEAAQAEQVAGLLRATRHLLILDNTESITAAPAAIPHALDPGEQQKLRILLGRLHGGRTLVLLGSRQAEAWLGTGAGIATYPLPGLDPQAASVLVDRILRRHHATAHLNDKAERDALQELVTLLGGYPLPLTVVLPVLAWAKPSAVLGELQAGGEAADPAGLIRQAVQYSHGKLDPALQASLQLLAPFTAVIPTGPVLQDYQDLLTRDDAVQELGPVDLGAALDQAITVGLAAPHPQLGYLVQVQPVLPWFLRSRLHDQPALQAAASQAHYQHYAELAGALADMLQTRDSPQQRAAGQAATRAEYANLTAALMLGLRTGQPISALIAAMDEYLDQAQQHDARRQLLDTAIRAYPEPSGRAQRRELAVLYNLAGSAALAEHRLDDATAHYQAELQQHQAARNRQDQGGTYHQLGWLAQEQRRFTQAEASFRQAIDIFLEFGNRLNAAYSYHHLGMVAQSQRRFAEAEANYRQALDIYQESGDRQTAAATYHQLGIVAKEQRRFAEAEADYQKALDIKLEFGDRHGAASTYDNLGTLAQEQGRSAAAEANYRQALDIYLEFGDRHGAASTYDNLGTLAQEQGRISEAEADYQKALDIKLKFGDRHAAASTYNQLGAVALEQGRFTEAEASFQKALDTYLEFGDRHSAAASYHNLGTVAQRQGRFAEAEASYLKALDTFLETGDQHNAAASYNQLGVVAQGQQRFAEAKAFFQKALDIRQETDPRAASGTASRLGITLASLGQHREAISALLYAAVTWHQETGHWDSNDLAWLHRESTLAGPDDLTTLIGTDVPPDLADELATAVSQATNPADDGEASQSANGSA